jgi:hypothetical protein
MTSGGARARSGPAPDPNAFRRERDAGEWTELPAGGRAGDPPDWPLSDMSSRELQLWVRLWRMPQALMWERFGQEFEVALYARQLERFERPKSPIILGTLVRQMADSLGLTTPGLRANRWKIMRDETAATPAAATAGPRRSSRNRLKVLAGGEGA